MFYDIPHPLSVSLSPMAFDFMQERNRSNDNARTFVSHLCCGIWVCVPPMVLGSLLFLVQYIALEPHAIVIDKARFVVWSTKCEVFTSS